jgi:hypothetical protein
MSFVCNQCHNPMKEVNAEYFYYNKYKCVNPLCLFPATVCKKVNSDEINHYCLYFELDKEYYFINANDILNETVVYKIISLSEHLQEAGKRDQKDGHNAIVVYLETYYSPNYRTIMKDVPKYFSRLVKLRAFS